MTFGIMAEAKNISRVAMFLISATAWIASMFAYVSAESGNVVISLVQTGSTASASHEYISIYNNSDHKVDVTDWCIYYSSASNASKTELYCFTAINERTRLSLEGRGSFSVASKEFLDAYPEFKTDETIKS